MQQIYVPRKPGLRDERQWLHLTDRRPLAHAIYFIFGVSN
jgi:hypothetical protein